MTLNCGSMPIAPFSSIKADRTAVAMIPAMSPLAFRFMLAPMFFSASSKDDRGMPVRLSSNSGPVRRRPGSIGDFLDLDFGQVALGFQPCASIGGSLAGQQHIHQLV